MDNLDVSGENGDIVEETSQSEDDDECNSCMDYEETENDEDGNEIRFPSNGHGINETFERLLEMAREMFPGFDSDISELRLNKPVSIAILDSGVQLNHKLFHHQKTLEKGLINDCTAKPQSERTHRQIDVSDSEGHGTFCAGIAVGDYSGIAPFAELLVGKTSLDLESISRGITWAMENNADIISISTGYKRYCPDLADAIYQALAKGIIIVCAASNDGSIDGSTILYPAKMGNVICVGSHGRSGEPSAFSGVGREMDFLAPGKDVWSASICGKRKVRRKSGTSYATPYVAGVCALVIAFADLSGVPGLRQKVSNPAVMKSLLRAMASQPGVHDQVIGHGLVDPSRLFRFSVKHFQQKVEGIYEAVPGLRQKVRNSVVRKIPLRSMTSRPHVRRLLNPPRIVLSMQHFTYVANILQDKQEAVRRNGDAVPGTDDHDNQLQLDFRRPMELLLSMTKFPQKAKQLKDEMPSIVERYIAGQFTLPLLCRPYEFPRSATVADLRLSNIDKHIGLDVPDGMIIRLNILDLLGDLFQECKALQLIMLTEVPNIQDSYVHLETTIPCFVYVDIVRLSQLEILTSFQKRFRNPQNVIFVAKRLDIDTSPSEKLDAFDELQCVHVQNITGNITGHDNNVHMSQVNSQFAGADRDIFTTLDDMPNKQTFKKLMSLPESEVFSSENEMSKTGTMFDEYMKLYEEELQTSLDESVRAVMAVLTQVNQMPQICKINMQLPAAYLKSSVAFSDQWYDIFYLSERKRKKRLELGKSLDQISSKARLDIAYLPAAVVKDVDSVLSCPILKNCNVLDLGEDLDIFELITWATVTSTHITTQIVLRCRQVNITNSRNLLELPPENVKVKFENLTLEVTTVLFNCDFPPWTNLSQDIQDKVVEYLKLFTKVKTWRCIQKTENKGCSTKQILQESVGLAPILISAIHCYYQRSLLGNPSCTCYLTMFDHPPAQILTSSNVKKFAESINLIRPDTVQMSPVSIAVVHTGTQFVNGEAVYCHGSTCNLSSEQCQQLLNQYVLSGGQDDEVFYGRRIGCRDNFHAEDQHIANFACRVSSLSISAVKRKLIHLGVPSLLGVNSNHLADSLTVMLKQEEAGRLPEVNIVAIPFGFGFHNQRLFEAICEVSGKRKIVITAALKMTSISNSLSEIAYPGLYGDVLVIGNCDEKGNASQLTPRGRELDFLLNSSCPQDACILAANLVTRILERAHSIGGEPLMRAICHNAVMRELLRLHCSARVGHHDFVHGYGDLNREDIFMFSSEDFKRAVADITSDDQFKEI